MGLAWSDIRNKARIRSNDNTATYHTADTDALPLFQNLYRRWHAKSSDRVRELTQIQWAGTPWSASVRFQYSTSTLPIKRILSCSAIPSSATLLEPKVGAPLEYVELWDMNRYYSDDADPVNSRGDAGSAWTYIDIGSALASGADVGVKQVYIWPAPVAPATGGNNSSLNYVLRAETEPFVPGQDTDVVDETDYYCEAMALVLAYHLAARMGQAPPFLQGIMAEVPDDLQSLIGERAEKQFVDKRSSGVRA